MTPPHRVLRTGTAVLLATTALACGADPIRPVQDESTCPGDNCSDDTRARFDAIADLDAVREVVSVSRSRRLDRGSSRTARVAAGVGSTAAAREVGLAVVRELEDWPGHADGGALVTVTADPPVTTREVAVEPVALPAELHERCRPGACAAAVDGLEQRIRSEVAGLSDLVLAVTGDVLTVRATAARDVAALAARSVAGLVEGLDVRPATRAVVRIAHRGPLELTLRLDDGWVCEQPPGVVVECAPGNSWLVTGESVTENTN